MKKKKIRNLKELDQHIQILKRVEQADKRVLKEGVSQVRNTSHKMELAFYLGKVATEIFRTWRKGGGSKSNRWRNVIISSAIILGIYLAQNYLDNSLRDKEER